MTATLPAEGVTAEVVVNVADFAIGDRGTTLITSGLGSCVALVLHDARTGIT
jgi:chemotaxis receptor (MCP) glutamine deamidase CheD